MMKDVYPCYKCARCGLNYPFTHDECPDCGSKERDYCLEKDIVRRKGYRHNKVP
jgi:rRNA maturation endonuclease Nob1